MTTLRIVNLQKEKIDFLIKYKDKCFRAEEIEPENATCYYKIPSGNELNLYSYKKDGSSISSKVTANNLSSQNFNTIIVRNTDMIIVKGKVPKKQENITTSVECHVIDATITKSDENPENTFQLQIGETKTDSKKTINSDLKLERSTSDFLTMKKAIIIVTGTNPIEREFSVTRGHTYTIILYKKESTKLLVIDNDISCEYELDKL